MKSGIYKITNTINGKVYIGQSININKRFKTHLSDLKYNRHHNIYLQKSFNKYGPEAFEFKVIKFCPIEKLDDLEKKYIFEYNSINEVFGYNLVDGGHKYRFFTDDVRKRMGLKRKGKKLSDEHKKNISKGNKGKKMSLEAVKKSIATKTKRGSQAGEKNGNALITDDVASEIIKELLNGETIKDITNRYNTTSDVVYNIMYNKSYTHLMRDVREDLKNRTTNFNQKKINKAITMYKMGYSQNKIANELKISRNTLRKELKKRGIDTSIHINQFISKNLGDSHAE